MEHREWCGSDLVVPRLRHQPPQPDSLQQLVYGDGKDHPFICVMCKQPTAKVPGGLCDKCRDEVISGGGGNQFVGV